MQLTLSQLIAALGEVRDKIGGETTVGVRLVYVDDPMDVTRVLGIEVDQSEIHPPFPWLVVGDPEEDPEQYEDDE